MKPSFFFKTRFLPTFLFVPLDYMWEGHLALIFRVHNTSTHLYPALSGITLFEVSNSASPIVGTAPCGCPFGNAQNPGRTAQLWLCPFGNAQNPGRTATGGCPYNRLITRQSFARNNAILPDAVYNNYATETDYARASLPHRGKMPLPQGKTRPPYESVARRLR